MAGENAVKFSIVARRREKRLQKRGIVFADLFGADVGYADKARSACDYTQQCEALREG